MAAWSSAASALLSMRTFFAPRSISQRAAASTSFTALVMVEAQWPQVMSFTVNSITGLLLRKFDVDHQPKPSHHGRVKRSFGGRGLDARDGIGAVHLLGRELHLVAGLHLAQQRW